MISKIVDYREIGHLKFLVERARSIVITCHLSPDGDAIGSSLALCRLLRNMGKRANVVLPDQAPHQLAFITREEITPVVFSVNRNKALTLIEQSYLIICLDFNAYKRIDKLGSIVAEARADKAMIDHHEDPEIEGLKVSISHPSASSTCELVFRVAMQAGWLNYLDDFAARCLFLGMMTDTGNFAYDNSNDPELFEIAAALMRYDIHKNDLYKRAIDSFPLNALKLKGYAISEKLEIDSERGAALITLTGEELERFNYNRGDTEGLVNIPLSIPGIRWSVFMRQDPEIIKISMRAEGDFTVDDICARYFHGGGHVHAAGGEFRGEMSEAVALYHQILETIPPLPSPTPQENNSSKIDETNNNDNED